METKAERTISALTPMYNAIMGRKCEIRKEAVIDHALTMADLILEAMLSDKTSEEVNTEALEKCKREGKDVVLLALMIAEAEGFCEAME